ncbi:thiamine phosphate synthase [Hymenobacter sp. BT770]|uniref:thiamine phosphate synthase n=1 Tax=Hymenobacter sp. BT770 TaxID=2886942 RepID=UPI001D10127E|nr:thiamine phosphate synthase [Hymenobacter sp. BT770]MCC3151768.1 thiamine phosphate synthase [Hymenobacter sp. BT770]MDO3413610.1 thiamine phosphate synthase [Hymenobacter sp. BT770]
MKLILLSPSHSVADEVPLVSEMLGLGLARFHVRKPGWSQDEIAAYVAGIPARYHARLVLHSHHALVSELGLGGVHLTAAARAALATRPPLRPGQTLSTSFHTLAEISQHRRRYDYVFLSPIFDSLSKEQYPAAFDLQAVAAVLRQLPRRTTYAPQVVALGGIEAHRLATVQQAGFAGAAVLGAVWQSSDPVAAFRGLQSIVGQPVAQ